jgi:glycerol-3-phosphate cytidylyltransferase
MTHDRQTHNIGFTIGCWDLLHHGHENHLRVAASECNYLLVGIVSDWLVRMQKGRSPALPLHERIQHLQNALERIVLQFDACTGFKIVVVDSLQEPWVSKIVDVAFAGEDQVERFYAHPSNRPPTIRVIERTPGVSTTLLRSALGHV